VLADRAELTSADLVGLLAEQSDLSPKAWPRHVWIADELPATATNKVVKRELIASGTHPGTGVVWTRAARAKSSATGPVE
jgi:fatty-acyl-CoA synthase